MPWIGTQRGYVVAVMPLAIMCSACGSMIDRLGSASRVNPHTVAAYHADQEDYYHDDPNKYKCKLVRPYNDSNYGAVNLDCFRFPEQTQDGEEGSGETAYAQAVRSEIDRNRLISILLKQSDNICTLEMGRFNSLYSLTNAGLGIGTTLLSGISTIVTGDTGKTIFSGAATVLSGTRDHINAEVFQHQVSQAINKAIIDEREKILKNIQNNFTKKKEVWPIDAAILDVDQYHQQCSLYRGLDLVLSAVDKQDPEKNVATSDSSNSATAVNQSTSIAAPPKGSATSDDEVKK